MITGDHPRTAASVAAATGVAAGGGPARGGHRSRARALSPEALRDTVRRVDVFARVVPEHKVRIVEALKRDGEIAAMTGDGVNDVPALKAAHIGVAMGRRGTDAASEAADMVLTDDDYSTIVRAIRQGRAIHENIVRFAHFLFAGNAGEVLAFALAVVLGLGAPLTVLQILLVNLLLDGLPAAALGVDPPEKTVMARPPRAPAEGLLDRVRVRLLVGRRGDRRGDLRVLPDRGRDQPRRRPDDGVHDARVRAAAVRLHRAGGGAVLAAGRNLRLFGAVALSAAVALVVLVVPAVGETLRAVDRPMARGAGAGSGPSWCRAVEARSPARRAALPVACGASHSRVDQAARAARPGARAAR